MTDENEKLRQRLADLETEVATLKKTRMPRGVRRRSSQTLWGLPIYDIAMGPDPDTGQLRGHARGIIAIGDLATGLLAFGGLARGVVAIGGVAVGAVAFGGCALGLLLAFGGLAVGGLAVGGGAIGVVAIGGGAAGYYACGGDAMGEHVMTATQQDPEAVRFFQQWVPDWMLPPAIRLD